MNQLLKHWRWRLAGLALLALAVVAYQPDAADPLNRLLIPLTMALAAALLVQNLAAVALGACLLATIHSDPASADWVSARAYPGLALLSAAVLAVILARRFHRRILDTREARWAPRRDPARSSGTSES